MEKIAYQAYLYDFYGELLTKRQQAAYEDAVLSDMSLSEIAAELDISRQGAHDLIKRSDEALCGYEEKLHLVERFFEIKKLAEKIKELASSVRDETGEHSAVMDVIAGLADQITDKL